MKKILCVLSAIVLALLTGVLSGCDGEKRNNSEIQASVTVSQTEETTSKKVETNAEIKNYLDSFVAGDSDFYGAWQPEAFNYMSIVFRNDELAEMVTGTEGYFSEYTLNQKEKTIKLQLMPNVIDGEYGYEFSKDKKKLTLSLDGNELVLVKQKKFSLMPKAPKKPMIDSNILGWWENEDGIFYCFQKNGIMYENSISMETCYTYTIEDDKIKASYSIGSDMTDEFTYSVKNGELTLNGSKCTRKDIN